MLRSVKSPPKHCGELTPALAEFTQQPRGRAGAETQVSEFGGAAHTGQVTDDPLPWQRIEASSFRPGLSYFGRSLDGQLDLDGDALVDLAVGAQGAAVVLR